MPLIALAAVGAAAAAPMTLEDAVERVQQEIQGRVLKAEEVTIGKKKLYRIKLLTRDGRVQVVKIPADENKESR
ncbi:MAG: PepSY domain-containing protein [Rhodanobacteraceae bacterium]|nr:PepSY domain-containing protein [Rhodanobacteraceae bacterium]